MEEAVDETKFKMRVKRHLVTQGDFLAVKHTLSHGQSVGLLLIFMGIVLSGLIYMELPYINTIFEISFAILGGLGIALVVSGGASRQTLKNFTKTDEITEEVDIRGFLLIIKEMSDLWKFVPYIGIALDILGLWLVINIDFILGMCVLAVGIFLSIKGERIIYATRFCHTKEFRDMAAKFEREIEENLENIVKIVKEEDTTDS